MRKHRELQMQKESQRRVMEDARKQQTATSHAGGSPPVKSPTVMAEQHKGKSLAFIGYEAPPNFDDLQPSGCGSAQSSKQGSRQPKQQQQRTASSPSLNPQGSLPPDNHPFNSASVCCYL